MNGRDPKTDVNYRYLKDNWDELLRLHHDKYVIIHEEKGFGSFDEYETAAKKAISDLGDKPFIVHHITDPKPLNFVFAG